VNANNEAACPFCGESILLVARKCKHCGEWLQANGPAANMSVTLANNISLNVKRVAYARNDEELTILANDTPVGQLKPAEALSVKFTAPGDVNLTFGISTPTGMKLMRTATFALPSGGASAIIRVESSGPVLISIRDSSGALIPARESAVASTNMSANSSGRLLCFNCKKPIAESEAMFIFGRSRCSRCHSKELVSWKVFAAGLLFFLLLAFSTRQTSSGAASATNSGAASATSRQMTAEEQATLSRLQDVWRGTCGSQGYDAFSQECAAYVTRKTIEWRKDAGLW